ncbi:MAG: GerMN domain-containing protein [Candidatus Paceibacterota bacterium]|jgi:hypothetical protein
MKYIIYALIAIVLIYGIYLFLDQPNWLFKLTDFSECQEAGNEVTGSIPRYCRTEDGKVFVEEVSKSELIVVDSPEPNTAVVSPIEITGKARGNWYFEASFPIKIEDSNGNILGNAIASAQDDWMTTEFVPFKATLYFEDSPTSAGKIVFMKDNPSGLPEYDNKLELPVVFGTPAEKMTVKAYFNNNELDPEITCVEVFPVEREVPKTQAAARAALEELLKGVTPAEQEDGYGTSINSGVAIQSLTIENGVARADFSEALGFQIGGSCRVAAIRSQITQTLKQFPTVNQVIISIDGRTEDILQP